MAELKSLLALEKIRQEIPPKYIVYSYLLTDDGKRGYFIPLDIKSSKEEADSMAKEIITQSGHSDILTTRFGVWIPLGITEEERIIPINARQELGEIAKKQEEERHRIEREAKRINKEIQAEQKAIADDIGIDAYIYDLFCAVQNKDHYSYLIKEANQIKEMYEKRLASIANKDIAFPQYKEGWKAVLKDKLRRRGEESQYYYIEQEVKNLGEEL